MKHPIKNTLIFSALLCLCGALFMVLGFWADGNDYMKNTDLGSMDTSYVSLKNDTSLEKTKIDDYTKIDCKLDYSSLIIKPSSDAHFYLSYNIPNTSNMSDLEHSVADGTLTLRDSYKDRSGFNIDLGFLNVLFSDMTFTDFADTANVVTLYVPRDAVLSASTINLSCGDVMLSDLRLASSDINLSYGSLKAQDSTFTDTHITVDDGDAEARGSKFYSSSLTNRYGDVTLTNVLLSGTPCDVDSGDMEAQNLSIEGQVDIKNNYGDIELQLASPEGLTIVANTDYGDIESALIGATTDEQTHFEKIADGSTNSLYIEVSDGDVTLN